MNVAITSLKEFIEEATSPYHVVAKSKQVLDAEGFTELPFGSAWSLESGGRYYTIPYGTTLYAFTIGSEPGNQPSLRIATAHTDHPCFHIKPFPEMNEHGYLKINTETYGGPILNTWLDRPLSVAGKVCLKSDCVMNPETVLFDARLPLLTIPNLAIHINREINKGVELNKQTDLAPIIGMMNETLNNKNFFMEYLAKELQVEISDILDFDLCIYNCEYPALIGLNQEFFQSPRLDNLTSVTACLKGIINDENKNNIHVIALYDNEEIGSRTKQGADSSITSILLEKIYTGIGHGRTSLYSAYLNSMALSVDVAHCLHPNYVGKNDPTSFCELGKGVVFKLDSNQKYAYDTEAVAILEQICQAHDVKYQKFVNRSDMTSGSTLGSILSSWIPVKTVDIGIPLLAMHSAKELMGTKDQSELEKIIDSFFKE
ncbi:M18 family aminopeptidase [[Clostridium] polysaccharolyticum]|uniref:M18 family aminopeptidase n=1 Tax=[Clostridium] polysaccharolyticum TaxID=29364 RepID=A0A1H9YPZ4_9FIRM|nr:M18 family aminopeptidase [[Clostridium] polysaccharolyticum]SES71209.1 aspartyl aminopeptidase [[Clostridium] polysaccharolyticum]